MNDSEKPRVALGRSRKAALRVLMPRLFGALNTHAIIRHDNKGRKFLAASRENFEIHLHFFEEDEYADLIVIHQKYQGLLFDALLWEAAETDPLDFLGSPFDEPIRVIHWDRS